MTDFDARRYWAERASSYRGTMETAYHRDRIRMVEALLDAGDLSGRVLDFGCGDGVYGERICAEGGAVVSVDIDPSMLDTARERIGDLQGAEAFVCGGLEALPALEQGSFDTILALNVLAYMQPDSSRLFLKEAARLLRPGGVLVCTHSNELFDLFTLNSYTVRFFKKHFAGFAPDLEVAPLLTNPDRPNRSVFPTRTNPLSYRFDLAAFGLREERQEFSILHPMPPLLMDGFDPDDLASRAMVDISALDESVRWKLMFMCSIFGSRAVRA